MAIQTKTQAVIQHRITASYIIETTICYKPQKYYGGGEIKIITSFNSKSNLVSGRSEPYLFIASAYVSLGKGFGNSTPLISRKTCNKNQLQN